LLSEVGLLEQSGTAGVGGGTRWLTPRAQLTRRVSLAA
jgi:hypothetical protein